MICVSIRDAGQIEPALAAGCRLLELRLDLMGIPPGEAYGILPSGIRTVATCRPGTLGEPERLRILREAIQLGASYLDLELEMTPGVRDPLVKRAKQKGCAVILSHHDFEAVPDREELAEILRSCYHAGADVAKIAVQVRDRDELPGLLSLYDTPGRKVILGMGPLGRISRVAAPYLGSEFTFASVAEEEGTAPGQLTYHELMSIYNLLEQS